MNEKLNEYYWLLPERIAAGKYPGARYDENKTRCKVQELIKAGFTCFIDLTEMGEMPAYDDVLLEEAGWYDAEIKYHHIPFIVADAPQHEEIEAVLGVIDLALASGGKVYLHCMSGLGRTGVAAACWLIRQGREPEQSLKELAELRKMLPGVKLRSPDSDAQWVFVLGYE